MVAKGTVEAVGRPKGVILLADCVARTIASGGADFELLRNEFVFRDTQVVVLGTD